MILNEIMMLSKTPGTNELSERPGNKWLMIRSGNAPSDVYEGEAPPKEWSDDAIILVKDEQTDQWFNYKNGTFFVVAEPLQRLASASWEKKNASSIAVRVRGWISSLFAN